MIKNTARVAEYQKLFEFMTGTRDARQPEPPGKFHVLPPLSLPFQVVQGTEYCRQKAEKVTLGNDIVVIYFLSAETEWSKVTSIRSVGCLRQNHRRTNTSTRCVAYLDKTCSENKRGTLYN